MRGEAGRRADEDLELVTSKIRTTTLESLIYEGIRLRKRSCPAVSQSYNFIIFLSTVSVFVMKSIPTVGYRTSHISGAIANARASYVVLRIEFLEDIPVDYGGLPDCLVAEKDDFVLLYRGVH